MLTVPFALAILAGMVAVARPHDHRWKYLMAALVLWPILFMALIAGLVSITSSSAIRYDQWFALADRYLGSPSWVLGRVVWNHPWLHGAATWYYGMSLMAPLAVIVLLFLKAGAREGVRGFLVILINPIGAGLTYQLLPASGPAYAFKTFPFVLPDLSHPQVLLLHAPPNCFPSVHLSTAILLAVLLWRWPWGRVAGVVHVAATVLVTLGLGEHYLVDLLASVPYVWMVLSAVKMMQGLPKIMAVAMKHEVYLSHER